MTNIEVLKELDDRKLLKPLVMAGLFPVKVEIYMQMFYHVDAQIKTGKKPYKAVCNTAVIFNVTPSTVYRALNSVG